MFFSRKNRRAPSGGRGRRGYIVGDVHGRLDLLDDLLGQIDLDLTKRPVGQAVLIFVGDLIDRGPCSAQVVERLRTFDRPGIETVFLLGNHEEVLLRVVGGEAGLIAKWREFGGKECLESYGADPQEFGVMADDEAIALVRKLVPADHVDFLSGFADTCRFGDYLVVHAGIRPGVEFERQSQADLRWIREPFLNHNGDHGFVVVHGHTIVTEVEERANRIAIDTGAYRSGRLTALVIDGEDRRYLVARQRDPHEAPVAAGIAARIDSNRSRD